MEDEEDDDEDDFLLFLVGGERGRTSEFRAEAEERFFFNDEEEADAEAAVRRDLDMPKGKQRRAKDYGLWTRINEVRFFRNYER